MSLVLRILSWSWVVHFSCTTDSINYDLGNERLSVMRVPFKHCTETGVRDGQQMNESVACLHLFCKGVIYQFETQPLDKALLFLFHRADPIFLFLHIALWFLVFIYFPRFYSSVKYLASVLIGSTLHLFFNLDKIVSFMILWYISSLQLTKFLLLLLF